LDILKMEFKEIREFFTKANLTLIDGLKNDPDRLLVLLSFSKEVERELGKVIRREE
jgi:hypothetical protein